PEIRDALLMFFWQGRAHVIHGTTEVDVTDSLAAIRRIEKELRIGISFHAFVVYCIVQAAMQHPVMHTYRHGRKLLTFEDIDLLSPMDKRLPGGVRIPVAHIIRGAQNKTLAEINWEIRQAVRAPDLDGDAAVQARRKLGRLPYILRRLAAWRCKRNPYLFKQVNGTMLVTNVRSQVGTNPVFAVAGTAHTTSLAIGNITPRLQLSSEGRVVSRKMLCLSGAADHDIVDGMGIAGFSHLLGRLLETGAGLDKAFVEQTRDLINKESHERSSVPVTA
ncbi:MAG TPA: 2-oxo acid dehydrogenase subunit E2, partial [Dyella sp.]|uniref:2-oxo acid dehydrogenase subunit E2 n=1 Tax=Dyella sp. TaxID=1869338 RepID=UPI002CF08241